MTALNRRLLSARWANRCRRLLLAAVVTGAGVGTGVAQAPPRTTASFATVHTAPSDSDTAVSWAVLQDSSTNPQKLQDVAIDLSVVQQPTPRVWARSQPGSKQAVSAEPPLLLSEVAEDDAGSSGELIRMDSPVILESVAPNTSPSTSPTPAENELGASPSERPERPADLPTDNARLPTTADQPPVAKLRSAHRSIIIEPAVFFPEEQPCRFSLVAAKEAADNEKARRLLIALGLVDDHSQKANGHEAAHPGNRTPNPVEPRTVLGPSATTQTDTVLATKEPRPTESAFPELLVQPPEILSQFANVRPLEEATSDVAVPTQESEKLATSDVAQPTEAAQPSNSPPPQLTGSTTVATPSEAKRQPIVQMRLGDDIEQQPHVAPGLDEPLVATRRVPERVFVNAPPIESHPASSPVQDGAKIAETVQEYPDAKPRDASASESAATSDGLIEGRESPRRPRPVVTNVDANPDASKGSEPARDQVARDMEEPAGDSTPPTLTELSPSVADPSGDGRVGMPFGSGGAESGSTGSSPAIHRPRPEVVRVRPPVALMLEGTGSPVVATAAPLRTEQPELKAEIEPSMDLKPRGSAAVADAPAIEAIATRPSPATPQLSPNEKSPSEATDQAPQKSSNKASVTKDLAVSGLNRSDSAEEQSPAAPVGRRVPPAITRVDNSRAASVGGGLSQLADSQQRIEPHRSPSIESSADVARPAQEPASVLVKRSSSIAADSAGEPSLDEPSAERSPSPSQRGPEPAAAVPAAERAVGRASEGGASGNAALENTAGSLPAPLEPARDQPLPERWDSRLLPHRQLDVILRQASHIRTQQPVARIEVLNRAICDVVQFSPYELAVVGKQTGVSMVRMWFDGQENSTNYLVSVRAIEPPPVTDDQFEQLRKMIREMFPNARVEIISETDRIIVRGTAPNNDEALAIVSLIRKLRLVPVVDRIVVERTAR